MFLLLVLATAMADGEGDWGVWGDVGGGLGAPWVPRAGVPAGAATPAAQGRVGGACPCLAEGRGFWMCSPRGLWGPRCPGVSRVCPPRVPAEPVSALDAALSAEGRTVGKGGLGLGHHRGGTLPHPAPQARPGTCLLCASVSPVAKACVGVLAVGGQGLGCHGAHGRPVRLSQNPSARPSWRRPERVSVGAGTRQPAEGGGWLDPRLEVGAWGLAPRPGSS